MAGHAVRSASTISSLYDHIRQHNWFAVVIDFLIVVVGVFMGVQVSNWNDASKDRRRTGQVIETLRTDLRNSMVVEQRFVAEIGAGLEAFDAARSRGERPVPYVFRIFAAPTRPGESCRSDYRSAGEDAGPQGAA